MFSRIKSMGLCALLMFVAVLFATQAGAQGLAPKKAKPETEKAKPAAEKATKPKAKPKAKGKAKVAAKDTSSEELATLQAEQESMKAEIEALKAQLDEAKTKDADLTDEQAARKSELQGKKAESQKKLDSLEAAVAGGLDPAAVADVIEGLKADIAKVDEELASIEPVSAAKETAALKEELATVKAKVAALEGEHEEAKAEDEAPANEPKPIKGLMVRGPGDSYVKVAGLLQAWMDMNENGAPDGETMSKEFYLRRIRIMVYGQAADWLNFFIETDNPRFGKNGDWSGNMFIQDAYVEFNPHPAFQIDVGMLLPPFVRHSFQAATSMLSLEYHGTIVRYPHSKVWRDAGVMVRGMPFDKWFEYRIGVFNGVRGTDAEGQNEKDAPRVTARLTFNILDAEGGAGVGGMFYDGLYLKKTDEGIVSTKKVLSIGGAFDWQQGVNVRYNAPDLTDPDNPVYTAAKRSDYIAAGGDLFWDIPFGANKIMSLNGQVNFAYYDHGDRTREHNLYNVNGSTLYGGWGLASELGFRYSYFQPLVIFDYFQSDGGWDSENGVKDEDLGSFMGIYGGFNLYLLGHASTLKAQIGGAKANGADEFSTSFILQAQFIF